jgi:hypothetical protein
MDFTPFHHFCVLIIGGCGSFIHPAVIENRAKKRSRIVTASFYVFSNAVADASGSNWSLVAPQTGQTHCRDVLESGTGAMRCRDRRRGVIHIAANDTAYFFSW